MMKNGKTWKITLSVLLVAAVVAAGVTRYQANLKKTTEEKNMENEVATKKEENQSVSVDEAQAEHTEELQEEETVVETVPEEQEAEEVQETTETAGEVQETPASVLPEISFTEDSQMCWPVNGQVVIDYSMDATTYFPTLDQYKYNKALVLSAAAGDAVQAAANGKVVSISENEETGMTLTMDLGNGFQAVYGQLKDLAVQEEQMVTQGSILGYINDPTKYYVTEGPNLYFAMTKDGNPVDPMIYLETITE